MAKAVSFVLAFVVPFAAFGIDLPTIMPELPDLSGVDLQQVFDFLDKNGDGAISLKEIKGLAQGMTPEVFSIIDPNGDGGVTQEELMSLSPAQMIDFVLAVFDLIDKNDDLMIQEQELKSFSLIAGIAFPELDVNGDGVLSFADIIAYAAPPEDADLYQALVDLFLTMDPELDGCLPYDKVVLVFAGMSEEFYGLLDKDHDGTVCYDDALLFSEADAVGLVGALLKDADTDGDDAISLAEAQVFIPALTEEMFGYLDQNGDGVLSIADLGDISPGCDGQTEWLAFALGLDVNHDACLTYEELTAGVPVFPQALFDTLDAAPCYIILAEKSGDDGKVCLSDIQCMDMQLLVLAGTTLLDVADTSGDGGLSLEEAQAAIPALTECMFAFADQNGDEVVNLDDFEDTPPDDPFQALVDFFLELDADGSGCWTHEEVLAGLPELPDSLWTYLDQLECGAEMRPGTDGMFCMNDVFCISDYEELIGEILMAADKDADGLVTLEEAQALVPALTQGLFDMLDMDRDGALTGDDFDILLPPPPDDPLQQVIAYFEELDADSDGCWTFEELHAGIPELPQAVFDYLELIDCSDVVALQEGLDGKVCLVDLACLDASFVPELAELLLPVFDADEDGFVTQEELAAVIPDIAEPVMLLLDSNQDGKLSTGDFSWEPPPLDPLNEITLFFAMLDSNRDGCWTFEELEAGLPGLTETFFEYLDTRNCDAVILKKGADGKFCMAELGCLFYGAPMKDVLKQFIKAADTDADGKVSADELDAFAPDIADALMAVLDKNGDDAISNEDFGLPPANPYQFLIDMLGEDECLTFEEFVAAMPGATPALFAALDADGDDAVCKLELTHIAPISWRNAGLEIIAIADADEDGAVTLAELRTLVPGFPAHLFVLADKDGDGVLSEADLPKDPAQEWPTPPVTKPAALLMWMLRFADADADGAVTEAEAEAAVTGLPAGIFNTMDSDDDGVLTVDDIIPDPPSDEGMLAYLLKYADADDNGEVTLAEARAVIDGLPAPVFAMFDANGDGVLSAADAPVEPPAGAREKLLRLLRIADDNNDGMVTLPEFLEAYPDRTEDDFAKLDVNGDGVLTRADAPDAELEALQVLLQFLAEADENEDGVVTYEELLAERPGLTPQQYAGFDFNGDGVLSRDDLPVVEEDPLARLTQLLVKADANGDRVVTFEELHAVAPEATQEQFDKLDKNADGVITPQDLPESPADPRDAFLELLREADANHDGVVTQEEFEQAAETAFDDYDANDDGVIDAGDMPDGPVPTTEALRHALLRNLVAADRNGDGELDYAEIAYAFPDAPAEFLARIDTDHSWTISRAELMAALGLNDAGLPAFLGEDQDCDGAFTAADVQLVINHALRRVVNVLFSDVDGNGKIDAVDVQRVILKVLRG